MKLYLLAPVSADNKDPEAREAREATANSIITNLLLKALDLAADPTLHAAGSAGPAVEGRELEIVRLADHDIAREWVSKSLNPDDPTWCEVRSLLNCRCVRFGYDGQAFLCLRFEDAAPASPDPSVVVIEECSHWLTETDYMDGFSGP